MILQGTLIPLNISHMTIFNEYLVLLRQVGAAMDMSLQGNQAYRRKLLQKYKLQTDNQASAGHNT